MLEAFHHRVARYICGRHIPKLEDGTWEYPSLVEVLEDTFIEAITKYII
jgi:hypothetical protein